MNTYEIKVIVTVVGYENISANSYNEAVERLEGVLLSKVEKFASETSLSNKSSSIVMMPGD